MKQLLTRQQKLAYLKGLQSGQRSLSELVEDTIELVFDDPNGGYYCRDSGNHYSEDDRQEGLKNYTWIDL